MGNIVVPQRLGRLRLDPVIAAGAIAACGQAALRAGGGDGGFEQNVVPQGLHGSCGIARAAACAVFGCGHSRLGAGRRNGGNVDHKVMPQSADGGIRVLIAAPAFAGVGRVSGFFAGGGDDRDRVAVSVGRLGAVLAVPECGGAALPAALRPAGAVCEVIDCPVGLDALIVIEYTTVALRRVALEIDALQGDTRFKCTALNGCDALRDRDFGQTEASFECTPTNGRDALREHESSQPDAVGERAVMDLCKTFRERDAAQIGTVGERAISDFRNMRRDRKLGQGEAVAERIRADRRHTFRDHIAVQGSGDGHTDQLRLRFVIEKAAPVAGEGGVFRVDMNCRQVRTLKGVRANGCHIFRKHDLAQPASVECFGSDGGKRLRERDAAQSGALLKSAVPNGNDAFRKHQLGQLGAVVEGVLCNGGHALRKRELCQIGAG